MPSIRVSTKAAPTAAEPARRGSKPDVARGAYKPRERPEPQTAEELAELRKRCRGHWGAELCDQNAMTYARELGRYVPVHSYLPPAEPDLTVTPSGWKTCRGCGVELELSSFSPNGRGGHRARCKDCLSEAAREYGRTPEGKAARARARAKYEAQAKAEEVRLAARERFAAVCRKTEAGRALLAAFEANSTPPKPVTGS